MMPIRHQPPVHSRVSMSAVLAAAAGVVRERAGLRERLRDVLCRRYAARDALLLRSGTAALRLALEGVRSAVHDRPVAMPAFGCFDLATAAVGADARVILYDLDPATLCPDEASLSSVLAAAPAALVVAPLFGYPAPMDRLAKAARDAGVVLIEDAAQGAGGRFQGTLLGSFGSLSVLSFGRGKGSSTGGGGALLAHDEIGVRIVARARSRLPVPAAGVRETIALGAQWALGRPSLYGLPRALPFLQLGETVYHDPVPPASMARASVGALQAALDAIDEERERRRRTAERMIEDLRAACHVTMVEPVNGAEPGYLRLPILLDESVMGEVLPMLERRGVAASYPAPLHELSALRSRLLDPSHRLPGARILASTLMTLPTHRLLEEEDLAAVRDALRQSAGR